MKEALGKLFVMVKKFPLDRVRKYVMTVELKNGYIQYTQTFGFEVSSKFTSFQAHIHLWRKHP